MAIVQSDSLEFLRKIPDFENDIIFADPPYNLGSEIIVRSDGRMDYDRKSDFMGKWDAMGGNWWCDWFREAYRTLKHGGYCILFSIDRQTALFKYYAHLAGFKEHQSLYWYTISGFPKSSALDGNLLKTIELETKKQLGIDIEWE